MKDKTARRLRTLGRMIGVVIVTFVLGEVSLRAGIGLGISALRKPRLYAGWFEDDDHWKLRRRWQLGFSPLEAAFVTHPILGWTPETTPDNPLGILAEDSYAAALEEPAVLFFGDSFVYGSDPAFVRYRIPQILDRLLPEHQVLNYGVPGYGVDQIYLRFREARSGFDRPIVLAGILTLDLDRSLLTVQSAPKPYFELAGEKLMLRGVPLPEDAAAWYRQHPPSIRSYLYALIRQSTRLASSSGGELEMPHRVPRKRELNARILEQMVREARAGELPLLFVLFYSRPELGYEGWRESFLRETLDRLGAPYLDTKEIFQRLRAEQRIEPESLYYPQNGHLNEAANCIVATAIAEYLETAGDARTAAASQPEQPPGAPIVALSPSLEGHLRVDRLDSPWAVESIGGPSVPCFGRKILWLGHGEALGVTATLQSTLRQEARVEIDVSPGPSRHDHRRTLAVTVEGPAGLTTEHHRIDRPTSLRFAVELQPGMTRLRLWVEEKPTVLEQPNGDLRPLMVQLRQIRLRRDRDER